MEKRIEQKETERNGEKEERILTQRSRQAGTKREEEVDSYFILSKGHFRAFVLSLSRAGGHVDLFAICFSAVRKFRNGREFFRCISATFKITADQAPIHRRRPSQRLLIPAKIGPLHGLDA